MVTAGSLPDIDQHADTVSEEESARMVALADECLTLRGGAVVLEPVESFFVNLEHGARDDDARDRIAQTLALALERAYVLGREAAARAALQRWNELAPMLFAGEESR